MTWPACSKFVTGRQHAAELRQESSLLDTNKSEASPDCYLFSYRLSCRDNAGTNGERSARRTAAQARRSVINTPNLLRFQDARKTALLFEQHVEPFEHSPSVPSRA